MAEYEAASFLSVGWMCIDALFLCVILCLWCRLFFFFHSNVPIAKRAQVKGRQRKQDDDSFDLFSPLPYRQSYAMHIIFCAFSFSSSLWTFHQIVVVAVAVAAQSLVFSAASVHSVATITIAVVYSRALALVDTYANTLAAYVPVLRVRESVLVHHHCNNVPK